MADGQHESDAQTDIPSGAAQALPEQPKADGTPTVKPGPPESDGPARSADNVWISPPLPAPHPDEPTSSSHNLPGVDPEASAIIDAAVELATSPSPKAEDSNVEISVTDLDEELAADSETGGGTETLETRTAAHIPDSDFDNAPRAPGASTPPDKGDKGSSTSFKTLQTLALLEIELGVSLECLTDLEDADAERVKKVMLTGTWCDTEDESKSVVITMLKVIEKRFARSSNWEKQTFTQLRGIFLSELRRRGGNMQKLAEKLSRIPPPLPKGSSSVPRPDPRPRYGK